MYLPSCQSLISELELTRSVQEYDATKERAASIACPPIYTRESEHTANAIRGQHTDQDNHRSVALGKRKAAATDDYEHPLALITKSNGSRQLEEVSLS